VSVNELENGLKRSFRCALTNAHVVKSTFA
jgi:hypothetical protein